MGLIGKVMKKYKKELIILFLQLFMFYIFPLFAGPTDAMGMVLLIICGPFLLGLLIGMRSNNKLKFLYPIATSFIFIPSIPIYYNDSALIHALWYLVVASVGLCLGAIFRWIGSKLR